MINQVFVQFLVTREVLVECVLSGLSWKVYINGKKMFSNMILDENV